LCAFESIVTPPVYMYMYTYTGCGRGFCIIYALRVLYRPRPPSLSPFHSGVYVYFFFILGCERKTPRRQWWRRRWVFTAAAGNWCQFDGRPSFTPPPPPSHRTYAYISIPFASLRPSSSRRGYTTAALLQ